MSEQTGWRLLELRRIVGRIEIVTGLHIGGATEGMEISGLDEPIIRNRVDLEPYVPGSSLKGKMRSLTEWYLGKLRPDGRPYHDEDPACPITRVFGGASGRGAKNGPTRLVVRDCFLSAESRELDRRGVALTEAKHENSIDRLTAMGSPRAVERVVPGVKFDAELLYRVFDTGDGGELDRRLFSEVVLVALALVQADCLGGGGSRGSGKVRFDLRDEAGVAVELPALQFGRE